MKKIKLPLEVKEYFLVKPLKIVVKKNIIKKIPKEYVLIKPLVSGICGSDLLYFLGQKSKEKLKKRLPLVLLHEGVGQVVYSKSKKIRAGQKVIINPLKPCGVCIACQTDSENFCNHAQFMASTSPGLARTMFSYPASRVYPIPQKINEKLAALAEPLTVGYRAFREAKAKKSDKIVVIGDGPVAYFVALALAWAGKISRNNLYIIGIDKNKLKIFTSFSKILNLGIEKDKKRIEKLKGQVDVVFECAGGKALYQTLPLLTDLLRLKGTGVLVGLTDELIPLNVIKVVNNGLTIKGSSRSLAKDYQDIIQFLKNKNYQKLVKKIINSKIVTVKNTKDLEQIFNFAADKSRVGRIILKLEL